MTIGSTALIFGLNKELHRYVQRLAHPETYEVAGLEIIAGELAGHRVLLTNAGIGKVNVSIAATLLYDRFQCELVIFAGLAGGLAPGLPTGDLIIATELIQHDYGNWIDGRFRLTQPSPPPDVPKPGAGFQLSADIERLAREQAILFSDALARQSMNIHFGRIISGDIFVLCQATRERLFREHQALAIEMEGAALAQVAQRFGRQCLIVRVVGDLAGAGAKLDEHVKVKRLDIAADFVQAIVTAHGR